MPRKNLYGYCPLCGAPGVQRERRPNGDDKCKNGHSYPSTSALPVRPPKPKKQDQRTKVAKAIRRIVAKINPDGTTVQVDSIKDLASGDKFRLWESTGEPVKGLDGNMEWIAQGEPYLTKEGVWGIQCVLPEPVLESSTEQL